MRVIAMRLIPALLLGLVLLAVGGCPPPPPKVGAGDAPPTQPATSTQPTDTPVKTVPETPPTQPATPAAGTPVPGTRAPAVGAPGDRETVREKPRPVESSALPVRVSYERLRGGVLVPRCPACGEVQVEGTTSCPGCKQAVVPWGHETLCAACVGSGACRRCGDDRPCLGCAGDGRCTTCDGRGRLLGAPCVDCGGGGACADCGGDGWRESTRRDFRPGETFLPGVCPTCFDGAGACPDCGATGKDAEGGTCLSCGGFGQCSDCGGSGTCVHDRGDGLCFVCGGGGREVVNGPRVPPGARNWNLRRDDGGVIVARLTEKPSPNVLIRIAEGGKDRLEALMPGQVHPISYYMAVRDFTPLDDARARMALATTALQRGLLPLAEQDFRRAAAADRSVAAEVSTQLRDIETRRIARWQELADEALDAGDRDRGVLLLEMVRVRAQGTEASAKAAGRLARVAREIDAERAGLDAAAVERGERARSARVARTVERARTRLDRARLQLRRAREDSQAAQGTVAAFESADRATWDAERVVREDAHRSPPSRVEWPEPPDALLSEARILRSEIALARAVFEVSAGRFEVAARMARRAMSLDAGRTQARKILEEAERGIARSAVLRASPPPAAGNGGDR